MTISGYEGGTGASPLTSIKHAGSPWEIGLAETHQTLVANRLRGRITVQVDGGFRTGRDVVIGALLGADEFGFATAPLDRRRLHHDAQVPSQHLPGRHRDAGPGAARRFTGQPEHVINFFFFVAEEVRELMAALGYRKFNDMIGQMQMLDARTLLDHWKARGLDFSKLFTKPDVPASVAIFNSEKQDHKIHDILDRKLIAQAQAALEHHTPGRDCICRSRTPTAPPARCCRARSPSATAMPACRTTPSSHALTARRGRASAPSSPAASPSSLRAKPTTMSARASPAAASSCARRKNPAIVPEDSIIVGNTVLYGAIEGECYFRGVAGERFAVRNSGAIAVVEGAGDHCCEYMTGGVVVVLGKTGRNFAAGMSGGIAYVLDDDGSFETRCNLAMVSLEPMPDEEDLNARIFHHVHDLEAHGLVEVMADMSQLRRQAAASLDRAPRPLYRFDGRGENPGRVADLVPEIPQGHADRVSACSQRAQGTGGGHAGGRVGFGKGAQWARSPVFSTTNATTVTTSRSPSASAIGTNSSCR